MGLAVKVLRAPRRSGVAGAKNIGQAHATTPVTFFLDAHSVPGRGSIERVVEPLLNREAAIAGPTFVALPEPTQKELLVGQFDDVSPEACTSSPTSSSASMQPALAMAEAWSSGTTRCCWTGWRSGSLTGGCSAS